MTKFRLNRTPDNAVSNPKTRPPISGVYVGIVKDNEDDQKMGRLSVWIPELGGNPNKRKNWYVVSYASPFAGASDINRVSESAGDVAPDAPDSIQDAVSQRSYGMWMVPPDLGNEVLVCFVNGDTSRGFWFACLYQQNMNQMVPALGTDDSGVPVREYNKKTEPEPDNPSRPVFQPLAQGLVNQGLHRDDRRGIATTSARRESPSKVGGFLSPRGHSIHWDEAEENEFIRLRTRSGVQILLHETDGYVFMISKNGGSWFQVGDDGISFYSENGFNLRTSGAYNIHSDGVLNIDAEGTLNIVSQKDILMHAKGSIHMAADGNIVMSSGGNASLKSAKIDLKSAGRGVFEAGGKLNLKGAGVEVGTGTVNLNGSPDSADAADATKPVRSARTDRTRGGGGAATSRDSATSRMPTARPWDDGGEGNGSTPDSGEPFVPGAAPQTTRGSKKDELVRAEKYQRCVAQAVAQIRAKHPDATFVTEGYLMAVAEYESRGFIPDATSPTGALGLFQFTRGTWRETMKRMGLRHGLEMRADPCISAYAAADLTYTYGKAMGRYKTDPTALYMAHNLGPGNALPLMRAYANTARRDASARDVLFAARGQAGLDDANHNPAVYGKPSNPRSVEEVYQYIQGTITSRIAYWENGQGKQKILAMRAARTGSA